MIIFINGEHRQIDADTTVQTLIDLLGVEQKTIAVAVNMTVVKKESWQTHTLRENDHIEILNFVGGG